MNRLIIALLGSVLYSGASMAQKQTYFTNPVIHGDVADPSILRIDDTYYATGTSSEWAPYYPVFTSKDLVNWKQTDTYSSSSRNGPSRRSGLRNGIIITIRFMYTIPHERSRTTLPTSE